MDLFILITRSALYLTQRSYIASSGGSSDGAGARRELQGLEVEEDEKTDLLRQSGWKFRSGPLH